MNLFAATAAACAAPFAAALAFAAVKRIKYRDWRRLTASVVSVKTTERRVSEDVSETPKHEASVSFACERLSYEKPLPPLYENNAPAVGSEVEILFNPKACRAVRARGLFGGLPRRFFALFFGADAWAFLVVWAVFSSSGGFPKFPIFYKPLLGLPLFAAGCTLAARYANLRRRAAAGKLRPIPAVFAGYRLRRDNDAGDREFALFEYEERGVKKYYESHTSGRRNLKIGDAATLYRDAETGKVTEKSGSVMPLIPAAVCFSSGVVVTAVMLLL